MSVQRHRNGLTRVSCLVGLVGASSLVGALTACAEWRQAEVAAPALKSVSVQQAGNGRFVACADSDCERPTVKTLAPLVATRPILPAPVMLATPPLLPSPLSSPAVPAGRAAHRVERATVGFLTDSAALDARSQLALRQLQPLLRQAKTIRAVGFTDDRGQQKANDHVAEARAIAVMQFVRGLLGDDLKPGPVLSANGQGKCCYLNGNADEAQRAANRRVELVLSFEDTPATDRLVQRLTGFLHGDSTPRPGTAAGEPARLANRGAVARSATSISSADKAAHAH